MLDAPKTTYLSVQLVQLYWKDDVFGHKEHDLFVGGLHIGSISEWRGKEALTRHGQWRAWIMGERLGWYATEQEARDACAERAIAELHKVLIEELK